MPSKNTVRLNVAESYYHVFARGASKQQIFFDDADYTFFISLFKRYLSKNVVISHGGNVYPHLYNDLDLLAYCLMPNHFHMYVYQIKAGSLSLLMRGVMTSYSRYFNTKYHRTGSLFENRYKAIHISDDSYNIHISRYIHMNPRYWHHYPYSSIGYYLGNNKAEWLCTKAIMELFENQTDYLQFLKDYRDEKSQLDDLKHYLADQ